MPCEDFKKVYFNAFDSGGIVYTIRGQPADHSSLSRSLIQDMPIRGACAQLGQFLIYAPRREETALKHVTTAPQLILHSGSKTNTNSP